ncbi:S1C family serine protease [Alloalcanivorax venustensis]|uniref:S1C family serine protease n=1 Tax=Alloalcanivorax venustensis TaxID=172371 RepID=UPI00351962D1
MRFFPVIFILLCSCAYQDYDAREGESDGSPIDDLYRSSLSLVSYGEAGKRVSEGSAFALKGGYVVTAFHNLIGAEKIELINYDESVKTTFEHVHKVDRESDIAVFYAPDSGAEEMQVSSRSFSVGDDVWAIGSPLGLDSSLSKGIVSSIRNFAGISKIQFTAPVSSGSSGGALVDSSGKVIGMTIETMEGGQNLNFAIPLEAIRETVEAPNRIAIISQLDDEILTEEEMVGLNFINRLSSAEEVFYDSSGEGLLERSDLLFDGPWDFYKINAVEGDRMVVRVESKNAKAQVALFFGPSVLSDNLISVNGSRDGGDQVIRELIPLAGIYYLAVYAEGDREIPYRYSVNNLTKESRYGSEWKQITRSDEGYFYIHPDTVHVSSGVYQAWVLNERDGFDFIEGEQYNAYVAKFRVDCNGQRFRLVSISYRLDSRSVYNKEAPGLARWASVVPGTVGYSIYSHLCRDN